MKLVAGLGNPGPRYAESRHNVGFMVLDELARRWDVRRWRSEPPFQGELAEAHPGGQPVLLLRPLTFMNASGQSVASAWRYYRLGLEELLVVLDDLDLPLGTIRVRARGSSGGHRGLADIIRHLGSQDFARLRIGIGRVHPSQAVDYVLGRFAPGERAVLDEVLGLAADAVECWVSQGVEAAMNRYNRRPGGGREPGPHGGAG